MNRSLLQIKRVLAGVATRREFQLRSDVHFKASLRKTRKGLCARAVAIPERSLPLFGLVAEAQAWIGSVIREQRPARATTRTTGCSLNPASAEKSAHDHAQPLVPACRLQRLNRLHAGFRELRWSSRPRPVNRLQATGEPRRVMRGGSKSCALGSKEQDGPEPVETQGKLSLSPKNRSFSSNGTALVQTGTEMDSQYITYLNSEAWKAKRLQRLQISNFRCSVCETKKAIEVHHLTYARIFNEDMADLLPLCDKHHEAAESLVARGLVSRKGHALFLATETVRLLMLEAIKSVPKNKPQKRHPEHNDTRNSTQDALLNEPWFIVAMKQDRRQFKKTCRKKLDGNPRFSRVMSNCFALYQRYGGPY